MAEHSADQIADHFRGLIFSGMLGADDRLPTVRQTARDMGVANATAAKAYRHLESAGLVVTRGAAGTRVAKQSAVLPGRVLQHVRDAVHESKAMGVSSEDLLNAVRGVWRDAAGGRG